MSTMKSENEENLKRVVIQIKKEQCNRCKKNLEKGSISFCKKNIEYYCTSCGVEAYKKDMLQQNEKWECNFCSKSLKKEENYFLCEDTGESFCSLKHFEERHGVFCPRCGKLEKETQQLDYLKVVSNKSLFAKILPLALAAAIVSFVTIIMIVMIKREEKKTLSSQSN